MTSVKIKTIDFATNKSGTESFDLGQEVALSEKNLAYVISWQLSKRRAGTAKTKTMAEISGTTAKPYKQKGTGNARQGSKRSVQFRGGRTCHGPMPRSFDYSLPKKIVKTALSELVATKFKNEEVFLFSAGDKLLKTTQVNKALKENKLESALVVFDDKKSANLQKSVRNLANVKALPFSALNVYDIVNFKYLLLEQNLLQNIKEGVL